MVMRRDSTSAAYIPLRVREIVQECLSPSKGGKSVPEVGVVILHNG